MSKANILVVDDTLVNLELLEIILDDAGYDVRTATSGKMALKSLEALKPDLILLDIMMPEIDGYETCIQIKKNEDLKDIPVIFLSAKSESEDKIKGFKVGAVDYLTKPFDSAEVLVRIDSHVSNYFLKKELEEKINIINEYVVIGRIDINGIITDVSNAFCYMSGYSKEELIGSNHRMLLPKDIQLSDYEHIFNTIKTGKIWQGEIRNSKKNGEIYWVNAIVSPDHDINHNIIGFTSIRQDITNQKRIEKMAITDHLTGLFNRRHFNEIIEVEINRSKRHNLYLSFFMIDIDYFKQYNDTYGHQLGDDVLSKVSKDFLDTLTRKEDFVFRLGGEEFGVLCNTDDCDNSKYIAQKVCKSIEELKIEHSASTVSQYITISIGVLCVDFSKKENELLSSDDIYKLADDELYKAKESGRNKVSMKSL